MEPGLAGHLYLTAARPPAACQVLKSAVAHDADKLELKLAMRSLPCATGKPRLSGYHAVVQRCAFQFGPTQCGPSPAAAPGFEAHRNTPMPSPRAPKHGLPSTPCSGRGAAAAPHAGVLVEGAQCDHGARAAHQVGRWARLVTMHQVAALATSNADGTSEQKGPESCEQILPAASLSSTSPPPLSSATARSQPFTQRDVDELCRQKDITSLSPFYLDLQDEVLRVQVGSTSQRERGCHVTPKVGGLAYQCTYAHHLHSPALPPAPPPVHHPRR